MIVRKIQFKLRQIQKFLKRNSFSFSVSVDTVVLFFLGMVLTVVLVQNIYSSISDLGNYNILYTERAELIKLQLENEQLNRQKKYFESPYFMRLYAREALNLIEEGQELYVVERSEVYDYEQNIDRMENVGLNNYRDWWLQLFL